MTRAGGDALMYLLVWTGAKINFGIAFTGGILLGAFAVAASRGELHLVGFDRPADLLRYAGGAALMGAGGVLALGCTIGQGITGLSTLAAGSLLAWLSILAGGAYGMKYLEEGSFGAALRAIVAR